MNASLSQNWMCLFIVKEYNVYLAFDGTGLSVCVYLILLGFYDEHTNIHINVSVTFISVYWLCEYGENDQTTSINVKMMLLHKT